MSSAEKSAKAHMKGKLTVNAHIGSSDVRSKRKRPSERSEDLDSDDEAFNEMSGDEEESDLADGFEPDTDDEIAAAHSGKSKKTAKRKRRATSPTTFGAALQGLLGGDTSANEDGSLPLSVKSSTATQPAILSLAPHIRRGAQSSRLNAKAARLALSAKRKREDRAHVRDVIGGWGAPGELPKTREGDAKANGVGEGEKLKSWLQEGGVQGYEKKLRKSAQRGVVKLFNAIRAAQNTTEEDLKDEKKVKKLGQAGQVQSGSRSDNVLGGKAKAVNEISKSNFFDLLRAGSKSQSAV